MKKILLKFFSLSIITVMVFTPVLSFACSRILLKNKWGTFVARNMDWSDSTFTIDKIRVFPKGIKRSGNTHDNPLSWVSQYGSVVETMYDIATTDGMNEKGLSGNLLYLPESNYGVRDKTRKGLFAGIWLQFFLDNFSTVEEAVDYLNTNNIQIVTATIPGQTDPSGLHISLQDSSGDSVIIEYIDGNMKLYHGKEYRVLTNQPKFEDQLNNLKLYDGYGGILPVPGGSNPKDRFVRANYYSDRAEEPISIEENVKMMLGFVGNVAQLMLQRKEGEGPETARTNFTTVADLTNLRYYMSLTIFHNLMFLDIKKLNLTKGAPEMVFDFFNNNSHGDIFEKLSVNDTPFQFPTEDDFTRYKGPLKISPKS